MDMQKQEGKVQKWEDKTQETAMQLEKCSNIWKSAESVEIWNIWFKMKSK